MKITSEITNAFKGTWNYKLFYGIDFIGNVTGNEKVTNITFLHGISTQVKELALQKVCDDLDITEKLININ